MSFLPISCHLSDNLRYRESVFGYITVLPGAFSAYRYIALQNDVRGEGPLQKYFLGETMVRPSLIVWKLALNIYSMELARTSLPQICIWLRIVYVEFDMISILVSHIYALGRSYAGNWCRNVEDHGFFTMSSPRTESPTRRTR